MPAAAEREDAAATGNGHAGLVDDLDIAPDEYGAVGIDS